MTRYLVPLAGFLVVIAFLTVGLHLDSRSIPSPLVDKAAPSFDLPRLMVPSNTLALDDLNGQVWLLNVWASWCVSCRAEHALLNELARSGQVVLIGLNYKDNRADATAWLGKWGNPYHAIAVDAKGKAAIDWGVYGVPETFVIDGKGYIRHKHIGPLDRRALDDTILPLVDRLQGGSA